MDLIDNLEFRRQLKTDPDKAIEWAINTYMDALVRIAFHHTRNQLEAEDVVAEMFSELWSNPTKIDMNHHASIESLLVRRVKYRAIDAWRKRQTRNSAHYIGYTRSQHDMEPAPDERLFQQEQYRALQNLIRQLPELPRNCILLRIDQQLSVNEIASRLSITPKSAEYHLARARQFLIQNKHQIPHP